VPRAHHWVRILPAEVTGRRIWNATASAPATLGAEAVEEVHG
jgi:hypothetical protein